MKKWKLYNPIGMQDILGENCYRKRKTEESLRKLYLSEGYSEIETPIFEFYDIFECTGSETAMRSTYKMADENGRILVARPEMTVPAARVATTKMDDFCLPVKLFYSGKCIRSDDIGGGKQKEFTQSGVEIIGSDDVYYDAMVIATAAQALKTIGINDFIIEIGQVDFFKGLMEMACFSKEDSEEIRKKIDSKDFFGVEEILVGKQIDDQVKKLILDLPHLYGKREMLEKVKAKVSSERLLCSIDQLLKVLDILQNLDVGDYFTVDLGMVKRLDYYTGIIFKGMTYGMGFPILGGGRYDNLCSEFGKSMAATGFSLGVDMALTALYRNEKEKCQEFYSDTVVCFAKTGLKDGAKAAKALRQQDLKVELMPDTNGIEYIKEYCKSNEIGGVLYARGKGIIDIIDLNTDDIKQIDLDELKGGLK